MERRTRRHEAGSAEFSDDALYVEQRGLAAQIKHEAAVLRKIDKRDKRALRAQADLMRYVFEVEGTRNERRLDDRARALLSALRTMQTYIFEKSEALATPAWERKRALQLQFKTRAARVAKIGGAA